VCANMSSELKIRYQYVYYDENEEEVDSLGYPLEMYYSEEEKPSEDEDYDIEEYLNKTIYQHQYNGDYFFSNEEEKDYEDDDKDYDGIDLLFMEK